MLNDKTILQGKGNVSNEQMEKKVDALFETFNEKRKMADAKQADDDDLGELKAIEINLKNSKE